MRGSCGKVDILCRGPPCHGRSASVTNQAPRSRTHEKATRTHSLMCDRWSYSDERRSEVLRVVRDALDRGDVIRIESSKMIGSSASYSETRHYSFQPDPLDPLPLSAWRFTWTQKQQFLRLFTHSMFCQKQEGTCSIQGCSNAKARILRAEAHSKTCNQSDCLTCKKWQTLTDWRNSALQKCQEVGQIEEFFWQEHFAPAFAPTM